VKSALWSIKAYKLLKLATLSQKLVSKNLSHTIKLHACSTVFTQISALALKLIQLNTAVSKKYIHILEFSRNIIKIFSLKM